MIKIFKDGSQWCALVGDDLQSGHCGFGDTPEAALQDMLKTGQAGLSFWNQG